jgi:hypothetical protein
VKKIIMTAVLLSFSAAGVQAIAHAEKTANHKSTHAALSNSSDPSDPPGWPMPPCQPNCVR